MASSNLNRRGFLKGVCAGTCGAAVHSVTYGGSGMLAYAMPPAIGALSTSSSVFILVNLAGGCSYNIAPIYNSAWRDRNPNISYGPENSLPLSVYQGLHPSLTALKQVFDEGSLALLNGVGLPDQSRSHDEATTQWFRANGSGMGGNAEGGWAARLTSQTANLFAGVSLGGSNDLTRGGTNPPRALSDLANFGEAQIFWNDERTKWFRDTRDTVMGQASTPQNDSMLHVRGSMENIQRSLEIIRRETSQPLPTIANPFNQNDGFSRACMDAARLIAAPTLGTRFIFLQTGGYDTHSGERAAQVNLFNTLNAGLRSLIQTAKALGRWNDVVIATMSEFCRTVENGSQGTDHGEKGPLMIMGGSVAGRQVNLPASPQEIMASGSFLSGPDIDFRQIFKEAVANMGFNADLVFPNTISFTPLGLFR